MVSAPTIQLLFNFHCPTADGLSPRVMFAVYFPEAARMMLKISLWLSCVINSWGDCTHDFGKGTISAGLSLYGTTFVLPFLRCHCYFKRYKPLLTWGRTNTVICTLILDNK